MTKDARFEDASERPLRLWAEDDEDLAGLSALVQDAVFTASEMRWQKGKRRFAILLNRFRWEDAQLAERQGRPFERVQSLLCVENVKTVQTQGLDPRDKDQVLSVLSLGWEPWETPNGRLVVTLAGDGAIGIEAESLQVVLRDVTRPYVAPSGSVPKHPV